MVFEVVPRDQWGAAPPRQPPTLVNFPVLKVVFTYHTGALSCSNREQCCKELRSIQANHFKRGMTDIAYNFLVGGQGEAYEGRGWGVLPSSQLKLPFGDRVDIAFIGNFTQDTLPGKVFRSSLQLISLGTKLNYITRQWEIENIQKTYYQKKKPLPKANAPHYKKKVEVNPLSEDNDDVVGEGKLRSKRKFDMDDLQDELGFANKKITNNDFSRFDKQVDRMAKEQKSKTDVLGNSSEDSLGNDSNLELDSDAIDSDEDDDEEFQFDDDDIFEQFEPEVPGGIYDSKRKAQSKSNKKLSGENDLTFDQEFDYDEEEFKFSEHDFKFNKSFGGKSNLKHEIKSTTDRQKQKDILQCLDKFGFDEEAFKFGKKYSLQVDRTNDISADSSSMQKNKLKSNTQKLKFDKDFKPDKDAFKNNEISNAKLNRRKVTSGKRDLKHDEYFDSSEEGPEFDKRIPQPRHKVKLNNDNFNFDDDFESDDSDLKVKDMFDGLKTVKANDVDRASLSKHKRNPKNYKHSLKFLNDQLNIDELDQKDFTIKKDRFKSGQSVDDDIVKTLIDKYVKSNPEKTKIENRTSKVRKNINSDKKDSKPSKTGLKSEKSHKNGVDGKSNSKENIDFDDEDIPRFDEKDFQMDTHAGYYDGNELKFDEEKLRNDPDLFFDDEQIYVNKP